MKKKIPFVPKVVIFDMDGVIVDSMPYHFLAWYEALRPYGVQVNCFDIYAKEGEKWEFTLKHFLERAGVHPDEALMRKIAANRTRIFKKIYKRFFFVGAPEFITCLKDRGYRLALVTGTPDEELVKILPPKLRGMFDTIVAGNHVKKGKPHPEPYLTAAARLGLKPKECVVIENAPYGIASAKKAGMFCFAVTTSLPKEYLKRADIVVGKLQDVMPFIETCPVTK